VLLGRKQAEGDVEAGKADVEAHAEAVDHDAHHKSMGALVSNVKYYEKIVLLTGLLFALGQGISAPFIAVFTGESITTMTEAASGDVLTEMTPILIKIGGLAILQFFCTFVWQTCLAWAASHQAFRWHRDFLKSLFSLDVAWYDEHEPAGVAAKLEADISSVYIFMSTAMGYLVSSIGQFCAGMSLAFVAGWQLALIVCATIPVLMYAGSRMGKEVQEQTSKQQADFARASTVAEEAMMAIRTVAAFGAEATECARFEKELMSAKVGGIRSGVRIGAAWGSLNFFYSCLYAMSLFFGGHVLLADESMGFDPSNIITVMISMMVGVSGLSAFSGFAPMMAKAAVAAKAMRQVMNCKAHTIEPPLHDQSSLPAELEVIESIEFKNVTFRYPTRPEKLILDNLSFQVHRGQKVAFVGESGCGKSTTIQLMERFYDPCSGSVLVNGVPLSSVPVRAWRKLIGFVGQEPVLFATSAVKNIKGGDESITDEEAIEAAKAAQIYDTLSQLPNGMETFVGSGGGMLSGGQRQRVAIARALAKKPQMILLDEATSALDNESERLVQATLDSLGESMDITTIAIAHRLTTIKAADVIYVLREGRCSEKGTHDELMEMRGEYHSMAVLQQAKARTEDEDEEVVAIARAEQRKQTLVQRKKSRKATNVAPMMSMAGAGLLRSSTALSLTEMEVDEGEGTKVTRSAFCRLLGYTRGFCWVWPLAFLVMLLEAATSPGEAFFFNQAIMALFEGIHDLEAMFQRLDQAVLCLTLVGLASGIATFLQNSIFTYIQESVCLILRKTAFASTVRMDMSFFDAPENQTASILVSLERHMNRVGQMLGIQLGNSFNAIFTCLVSIFVSFFGSWLLALMLLALLPISGIVGIYASKCANSNSPQAEEAYAVSGKSTTEAATQIRTVRALGCEKHTLEIIESWMRIMSNENAKKSWKQGLALGLNMSLIQGIYLAGFWLSSACIQYFGFKASDVLLTLFCVVFGVMSVSAIVQYIPDSASGEFAAMEVFRLMDQESKIDATQPTGEVETLGDGNIEFKNVSFFYPHRPETRVLRRLNFRIEKGQSVAFVGFSGSGKSTVIQLLQRFYDPQGGAIRVGGVDLRDLNVAWWRRQVGMVGQEPILFDTTLEENVKYGCPEATQDQLLDAAMQANMDYVLTGSVKWTDRVGLRGEKLSGGQKQRCAIARALLRRPQLMLLDEATSALDSTSERLVQQAMQAAREGKTTITVAHRLSTIRNCDRIFVLSAGSVVEKGTYNELVALNGNFAKLAARSL